MLRYVLLALLADGDAKHGYALMKAYAERSGVRLSIGNIYRELQHLVADGFIATVRNPLGADPRRSPYAITEAGRDSLATWLAAPVRTLAHGGPDALSYRLAILGDLDPLQAVGFLDDVHGELWAQAKHVERERAAAQARARENGGPFSTRELLLIRSAQHLAADIELVDDMRSRLLQWQRRTVGRGRQPAARRARFRRTAAMEPGEAGQ